MTYYKGRLVQVKRHNGTSFVLVGGAREKSITINNEPVDTTTDDDSGIRTLLEGGGVTSMSIKLGGVYADDSAIHSIRTDAATNAHRNYQFVMPGTPGKTYEGSFMIASFEEAGEYNGNVGYNITFESAGPISIS